MHMPLLVFVFADELPSMGTLFNMYVYRSTELTYYYVRLKDKQLAWSLSLSPYAYYKIR